MEVSGGAGLLLFVVRIFSFTVPMVLVEMSIIGRGLDFILGLGFCSSLLVKSLDWQSEGRLFEPHLCQVTAVGPLSKTLFLVLFKLVYVLFFGFI